MMLGSAFTFKCDGHIRVDIFYQHYRPTTRAWLNSFGVIFLLIPFSLFTLFICWPGMITAWKIGEASANTGGIPLTFLLKSLPPAMAFLLLMQGIAHLLENTLMIVWQPSTERAL